jgi:hypothetical protein
MSHPASRLCHAMDAAQPPEGSVMNALFSSRRHGLARECVFWCPLVTEWEFCSGATRSGKRRLRKKLRC